ncbi:hypothetical protein [Mycobacterium sp. D16R24]|uniref:hypothetical protein n=1 Tax=Mycobacterium sp. D16R24 TaxID=1855656 RepID=UPI00256FC450|nr:hypothetical protein [Mycobacterium sp. D16R24]
MSDPTAKLGDAPSSAADLGAYSLRGNADEFLNRGQITVHQLSGVRGPEDVLSSDVRCTLFQDYGEHVAVEASLHQQWTWKIRVYGEAEKVVLVLAEGFSQQAPPERSRVASPFELNNLSAE